MEIISAILPKVVVILGPTASGKTDLGIALAKEFNGEIISADSRQVYKKMTVATGKPLGEWQEVSPGNLAYVVEGVPHYAMDLLSPDQEFTVADFKRLALEKIADINRRGKVAFLVGGTGLYLWSVIDNLEIPAVAPNKKWRQEMEGKSLVELVETLKKLDPVAAGQVDLNNPRRVLRALEVIMTTGESFAAGRKIGPPLVQALQIGIQWSAEMLRARITSRIKEQLKQGLIPETKQLGQEGYASDLPSMSGIGYKDAGSYLQGELSAAELEQRLITSTWRYAKRQLTWFRANKEVVWVEGEGEGEVDEAKRLVRNFLF